MSLLGYSLDNRSLMALTLAIGFLVDDAIVFLENTVRRMEHGENALQASLASAKEISFTILSMTLSLAAVFIPLVFMPGLIGRIFREFAITIVVAIFASGIVSLTLTPLMTARMLKERDNQALYADPSLLMAVDATGFTGLLPSNMGIIYAFLKPGEQRPPIDAMAGEMMGRLGAIPGVFPLLRPFPVLQISTGATNQNQGQYAFAISGTDAGQVYQASDALMGKLRAFPGFASLSSDAFRRTPRLEIDVLREQAKAYGVSEARILALLRNAYSQDRKSTRLNSSH